MPKLKTKKSVAKRFRRTKKGKFKRAKAGRRHILTKKSRKRKRHSKQGGLVAPQFEKTIRKLLPYG